MPGDLPVLRCLGKPLVDCPGSNLGTRGKPEFGEDMGDMRLHGAYADHQLVGNGAIGFPLGDQACHLALTRGQPAEVLLERLTERKRRRRRGCEGMRERIGCCLLLVCRTWRSTCREGVFHLSSLFDGLRKLQRTPRFPGFCKRRFVQLGSDALNAAVILPTTP